MKKHGNGVTARLPALLVAGSLAMAMQVSMAHTGHLSVGEDSVFQEQPLSTLEKSNQAQSNRVKAPPRPQGSDKVVVGVGLNPVELKRQKRAHSASKIVKKDPTRDDSLDLFPVQPLLKMKKK